MEISHVSIWATDWLYVLEKLRVIDSEKVVEAKAGTPTVAEIPLWYCKPSVTDQEQVDEVEVDFLKSKDPSFFNELK